MEKPHLLRLAFAAALIAAGLGTAWHGARGSLGEDVFTSRERYGRIAVNLSASGAYSHDGIHATAWRLPGYVLMLVPFSLLPTELRSAVVKTAQVALLAGALSLVLSVLWRQFHCRRTLLLYLALVCTHLHLAAETLAPRETTLFTAELALLLWVLAAPSRTLRRYIIAGAIASACALTRPTGIVALVVVGADLCLHYAWRRLPRGAVVGAVLAAAVVLAPWQIYVWHNFGLVMPGATTTSGANLFKGNNRDLFVVWPLSDVDLLDAPINRELKRLGIDRSDEIAEDTLFRKWAWAFIAEHPFRSVLAVPIKIAALLAPIDVPFGRLEVAGDLGSLRRVQGFRLSLLQSLNRILSSVAPMAIAIGLCLWMKRRRDEPLPEPWLLGLVVALIGLTLVHALTWGETRFRLPLDVLLAAPAARGLAVWLGVSER